MDNVCECRDIINSYNLHKKIPFSGEKQLKLYSDQKQ